MNYGRNSSLDLREGKKYTAKLVLETQLSFPQLNSNSKE